MPLINHPLISFNLNSKGAIETTEEGKERQMNRKEMKTDKKEGNQ